MKSASVAVSILACAAAIVSVSGCSRGYELRKIGEIRDLRTRQDVLNVKLRKRDQRWAVKLRGELPAGYAETRLTILATNLASNRLETRYLTSSYVTLEAGGHAVLFHGQLGDLLKRPYSLDGLTLNSDRGELRFSLNFVADPPVLLPVPLEVLAYGQDLLP